MRDKSELDLVVSKIAIIDKIMDGKLSDWLRYIRETSGNFKKGHSKEQLKAIQKLESFLDNPKQVSEITIIKGGTEYTFSRNEYVYGIDSFVDVIEQHIELSNEYRRSKGVSDNGKIMTLSKEYLMEIRGVENHTDWTKQLFNHTQIIKILPTERQRFLLVWELYRRASYPFTKQQIQASDQNKAALIRNWFKRNKNQKFTS